MNRIALDQLPADVVAFRRAVFFGAVLATTGLGTWLMIQVFLPEGISVLEGLQLVLFFFLFQQIATGFWLALFGFLMSLGGGDRIRVSRLLEDEAESAEVSRPPTAIVLPIFNENVDRVFSGIEAMWKGLCSEGGNQGFDFFILSDSNRPENWLQEEMAWLELCRRLDGFGRIFYRKRRVPRNGKSGNVADFCRRWGARYRYMVVLDADSIMTGRLLKRLVAMMEKNPRVGLIQTAPQMVMGRTLFRRMQQFAARVYAPLFSAGSNFWHLFGANYWGHNAIIRVRPFMEHCDLPELPDPDLRRRHILSHDTVEAALMRKAGYEIWYAYDEDGSYEEGPPNLADSLGRDRRWCQGNLQHFWFLFAPGIDFANRFHIWMGVMAYLSSALWFVFLILGAVDLALKYRSSLLTALPGDIISQSGEAVQVLLLATLALLFVPKVLAFLITVRRAKAFGGVMRLAVGTVVETLISALLAPSLMLYYTRFVVLNLLNRQVRWGVQNRNDDRGLSLWTCLRAFWIPPAMGVLALGLLGRFAPREILLLSPILAGWLLAPFVAWLTSSPRLGKTARRAGIFLIPEETELAPEELKALRSLRPTKSTDGETALAQVVIEPLAHAVHVALLRQRARTRPETKEYREALVRKALHEGPQALSARERLTLLWDVDSLRWLHREFWSCPADRLHPWWRQAGACRFAGW